jgi:hypothetical protein
LRAGLPRFTYLFRLSRKTSRSREQNRMISNDSFTAFAARLRGWMSSFSGANSAENQPGSTRRQPAIIKAPAEEAQFDRFARELFALQFEAVPPYRNLCRARNISPGTVAHWTEIPAVPSAAFKEFELTAIPPGERTRSFHSSGTTEQRPGRHFHDARSMELYEASLLPWFQAHLLPDLPRNVPMCFLILTPPPEQAPHSSLVQMFETVRKEYGSAKSAYAGVLDSERAWGIHLEKTMEMLGEAVRSQRPVALLGTAFSFVHLLDGMAGSAVPLPAGSRVLETGGYKGRSRALPKAGLHAWISRSFGIAPDHIVAEYGMSELSSQAYDLAAGATGTQRWFRFPPWSRAKVISPETGREVDEGQRGLLRVFDLANTFSVLAVQTEDLAIRRGWEFELLGRAVDSEPRGCSLMSP